MARWIDSYREQVDRLSHLAADVEDPSLRFELLKIASSFRRLAEFANLTIRNQRLRQKTDA